MTLRHVLSGCSGGGKSTLLDALARRGVQTFAEPGRRAVREGIDYRTDPLRFARRCVELASADHAAATGPVAVYDRSLLDVAVWFRRTGTSVPADIAAAIAAHRYAPAVFLVPPWPELFAPDAERRHGLDEAVAEYDALLGALPRMGYHPVIVPRAPVEARADWLLRCLGGALTQDMS